MLEGLVAWVLNNYLGKYVENLNTDQLSIAILSGEVELENLPLRRDALRHLGVPIEIRAGHIGKVKLQIPISALRSAPWVIVIEQLYLVAGPLSLDDWDQAAEEAADQERKLQDLDKLEAAWRIENDGSGGGGSTYYASSYSSWLNYGTGIITDIMENMQLRVRDVHLRYEDASSLQGVANACACGLTIESLSAQSCDSSFTPQFTTHRDGTDLSFKTIELKRLAIYWDTVSQSGLRSRLPPQELATAMAGNGTGLEHRYLVAPVSACAHLQRNRSDLPLRSGATPRFVCDLRLDQVPLSLIDWQYEQMVSCMRGLEFLSRVQLHRRRRPSVGVHEDVRAWWHYAASCHVPGACQQRPTWTECHQRAIQNIQYVDMYSRMLAQPSAALGSDAKRLKDTVEWSRDFQELKALREVAMRRVPCPTQPQSAHIVTNDGRNTLVRWFPQWWGWHSAVPADVGPTDAGREPQHQLEDEILEALADSARNNTLLRRDVVFGKFNFVLNSGTLDLCATAAPSTECNVPMLQLQFSELRAGVESRPRSSTHKVELSLGALCLRDRLTPGTLFPVLIGPPGRDRAAPPGRSTSRSKHRSSNNDSPLFALIYESGAGVKRLHVRSQPLDVVYQPAAAKWLLEFVCAPHQRSSARHRLEAMKTRTKQELMDKWEGMLEGRAAVRTSWDLRLDVSAPQLILVERFCDPTAAIAVVDLGTLRLGNGPSLPPQAPAKVAQVPPREVSLDEDDDEMFMTPCSTPPGSGASTTEDNTLVTALSELSLHRRLYDTYTVELSDIQVLVGRVRDNWRYAHTKGSSALHVLDRFNISLQVERRVVPTTDPMYPSLTLAANLPRLVVHVNEQKVSSIRTLARVISEASLPSPFNASSPHHQLPNPQDDLNDEDAFHTVTSHASTPVSNEPPETTPPPPEPLASEPSRLLTVQFTVDQMSLEVQSRGRSIAELQVSGVTASLTRRPCDVGISLTVHGLLLVDALQTFGPDFELLVASHRHVGMDSMSGSLFDSEPTSPTSPGSPEPGRRATSPIALTRALSGLAISPPPPPAAPLRLQGAWHDAEALISVEFVVVSGVEPLQLASIQFNNLDIIANQETIVELVGFVRRVRSSGSSKMRALPPPPPILTEGEKTQSNSSVSQSQDGIDGELLADDDSDEDSRISSTRTELTFDFHRLSVLLLRGGVLDGKAIGRKIGTATMCEARIQATVDDCVSVRGSLGGLQVLDLTPEGHLHQRIISVGRDPLADDHSSSITESPMYRGDVYTDSNTDQTAFSFNIKRPLQQENEPVDVSIRMASVWYTHSPQFITELRSCATEFKQYLADVARSIRSAATDVALGLVHARTEALAQSLYVNSRITGFVASDVQSPRRIRRRSASSEPQTPYSPVLGDEDGDDGAESFALADIKLDIVLDSPVIVLPRSSASEHVLVAHLGKITVNNNDNNIMEPELEQLPSFSTYAVEVRNMSLCTLDTSGRCSGVPRMDQLYACGPKSKAVPVLHDTLVRLTVSKRTTSPLLVPQDTTVLDDSTDFSYDFEDLIDIQGSVVNALRVSLTRAQYEQVLDTLQCLAGGDDAGNMANVHLGAYPPEVDQHKPSLSEIAEEDVGGVSTLSMDPHVRAKLFPSATRRTARATSSASSSSASMTANNVIQTQPMRLQVRFEVASFGVEIRGKQEDGLVGLSFQDFLVTCDRKRTFVTEIAVSLRSLLVEDLLVPEGDVRRKMLASRDENATMMFPQGACASHSCPDVAYRPLDVLRFASLPDHLNVHTVFKTASTQRRCVPRLVQTQLDGLVSITSISVDPAISQFDLEHGSMRRTTTIDLGSVDMAVSATSWMTLLDFFSVTSEDEPESVSHYNHSTTVNEVEKIGDSSTTVSLRSFTMLATRCDSREIARARVTGAHVQITRKKERRQISGRLGALRIVDATASGHLCTERFVTIGEQAVEFNYSHPPRMPASCTDCSEVLVLDVSPCVYVHTKRFVTELRAFFGDFSRDSPSSRPHKKMSELDDLAQSQVPVRLSLEIRVDTPVVLVPVRPHCGDMLVFDLGQLSVHNEFKLDTVSSATLLDVMTIVLHDVDVYAGEVKDASEGEVKDAFLEFGGSGVIRHGGSLLGEKCRLEFQVVRNLTGHGRRHVPDMTISSRLSTLELSLDVKQYALIRGVLGFNLGEDTEHILSSVPYDDSVSIVSNSGSDDSDHVWTLSSVRVELLDVRVRLRPLACVNFVRSRLTVDSFSDLSQDIDLVSQQVLITDERANCFNVFTEVLRPASRTQTDGDSVQAEIHSRRRRDKSKFTVLLNNMRLMAIVDWWQLAGEFIFTQHQFQGKKLHVQASRLQQQQQQQQQEVQFELKLNITDSEIVVVEDTSKQDTNAVILRSTTLVTYRPDATDSRPLSCSVNHLELFSCVLGADRDEDEETALSIVDPVTVSADVCTRDMDSHRTLDVQLHELTLRVSYKDMLMFAAMLESVTKQTCGVASSSSLPTNISTSTKSETLQDNIGKLCALGFGTADCTKALKQCDGRLDDAALWLTQNATPLRATEPALKGQPTAPLLIQVIEVRAASIRLCLIDDYGDIDIPLAETTLTTVCVSYELNSVATETSEDASQSRRCTLDCTLALDYYNRVLGGWEPFVEAWRCKALWIPEDTSIGVPRHRITIQSDDVLDVNVTDASIALFRLVKEAWSNDELSGVTKTSRLRLPFVPYSLKNDTGTTLYFATVITEPDEPFYPMDEESDPEDQTRIIPAAKDVEWTEVLPGAILPFSYGSGRTKQRHKESHMMRAHQLAVRVVGWRPAAPVTVDRVGIYFRHAYAERGTQVYNRPARLVFDVRLDGTARKLVTVRSAMLLVNRLPDAVDVKLVERSTVNAVSTASRTAAVLSGGTLAVPLAHAHSHIFVRPSDSNDSYSYCQPDVPWSRTSRPGERTHSALKCTTNRGNEYWLCCEVRRERYPSDAAGRPTTPAHTVLLLPALLIVNLLPQEMHYSVTVTPADEPPTLVARGHIHPGQAASVPPVDPDSGLEVSIHVENFRCASGICVPAANLLDTGGEFTCRIRLEDSERRRLFLNAKLEPNRGARVRLTITAPYWIVNRTGLPLVFRQEGVGADTAGQFEEHELARMVAPLLFSFADQDASPTVVARVGYKHTNNNNLQRNRSSSGTPIWCQQFHLRRGVQVRKLRVSHDSSTPDTVYSVGIEVRGARGRTRHRRDTSIVTVSPRLQLYNGSSHRLEFAQLCHATTVTDPGARAAHVHAPPGCHVPFHWPRLDRDQLLCVRCTRRDSGDAQASAWSGGLRIDAPLSSHVMLREALLGLRSLFLHVEVVPQGATHYVVFSDADSLPPPLRMDNCSEVAVTFAQSGSTHVTVAHAHRSVPYAWDEPTWPARLVVTAPGGVHDAYDVDKLGRGTQLTYENFIYVAFIGTFNTEDDLDHYDEADYAPISRPPKNFGSTSDGQMNPLHSQRLVLDVTEAGRVFLAPKQPGKRSQLWRMTSVGQLQHEGSSPPDSHHHQEYRALVLDIEGPAPQPSAPVAARLALRRPDPRRRTTQTWRFTGDGRLCCAHRNMCVQSQDGLLGLRLGSAAVLAAPHEELPHRACSEGGVPLEQGVGKQRMRPGSGLLSVEVTIDGPTRVLRVTDMKQREPLTALALVDDIDWVGVSPAHRPANNTQLQIVSTPSGTEFQITVMLREGLGVSIVGGGRELLYLQLNNIIAEAVFGGRSRELCISVQDAQCDNQLADTPCPVLLNVTRPRTSDEARRLNTLPVLELRAEVQPTAGAVVIFKHLIVCVRPVAMHIEETLILRMYEFLLTATGSERAYISASASAATDDDDEHMDTQQQVEDEETVTGAATTLVAAATSSASLTTRYHFGIIRLVPGALRLSVYTSSSLPARLRALKRRLGLTLVRFEDAPVELEPYVRHHPFETGGRLWRSVLGHFRDELLWQAATILGSVDFLGSPLGLLGDVTEGVSGLIRERSVGALVLNVAHGLSNSAAKVTETLGDGLGRVTMDDAHEEMRQRIRRKHARGGTGGEHLVAGIKGLGFGLLGGATGIFKQVYEGAASDGLQGVFSGLGKGLVGAVAKPMVGVLDLATETARAVRDSSRGVGRMVPDRRRQPRAAIGPGGLLPQYSLRDSWGQAYLRALASSGGANSSSSFSTEMYVAYECVKMGTDDLRVIVSSERVRVVTGGGGNPLAPSSLTTVTETGLGELVACTPVTQDGRHYIEIWVRGGSATRRPRIRCDTEELARAVTRQVNYAKRLHEEAAHTLRATDD